MDSLAGKLLIATPDLDDSNFKRSVVFMIQHTDQGATGVILNQPLTTSVSAIWDEISDAECECDLPVNRGGPVEGPLLALHRMPAVSEREVIPDVHLSMHREALHALVMQSDFEFRIFSGYSGWTSGQLEMEIENGGWLTLGSKPEHIFTDQERLWRRVCEHVGHDVLKPHLGKLRNVDATLN